MWQSLISIPRQAEIYSLNLNLYSAIDKFLNVLCLYVIGIYSSLVNYRSASNQSQLGEYNSVRSFIIVILMSTTYSLMYSVSNLLILGRCFSWSWIYDNFAEIQLPQNNNHNDIVVNVTRTFAVFCEPLSIYISFSSCLEWMHALSPQICNY